MNQSVIGTILPLEGGGAGAPPMCRPSFFLVRAAAAAAAVGGQKKSCFDLAQNRAVVSLWVGAHRYRRDSCASKLLWV